MDNNRKRVIGIPGIANNKAVRVRTDIDFRFRRLCFDEMFDLIKIDPASILWLP
jgi:hypothetical protein